MEMMFDKSLVTIFATAREVLVARAAVLVAFAIVLVAVSNPLHLAVINPFTPKLKKYILPTFSREMYKWGSENWYKNLRSIWVSYEKPSSSYCVM